jgi:hypothetical protein
VQAPATHEKRNEMKKIAAALVALVTLTALLAGLLGTAVSSSTAAPERVTVTKRLMLNELASRGLGPNRFVGTDRIKSRGKFAGFVSYTGAFDPDTGTGRLYAGLALKGGLINARVPFTAEDQAEFAGRITGGLGKYQGITGTITGRTLEAGKTLLILTYEL